MDDSPPSAVLTAEVEHVADSIDSVLGQSGRREHRLRQLLRDIRYLCYTHPCVSTGEDSALDATGAATVDITSALDECLQFLADIPVSEGAETSTSTSSVELAFDGLERSAQHLKRALEESMAHGSGSGAEGEPTAPPSYEAATTSAEPITTGAEVITLDDEATTTIREGASTSAATTLLDIESPQTSSHYAARPVTPKASSNNKSNSFLPYSDEKTPLAGAPKSPIASSSKLRRKSRGISCIAPSIPPGTSVIQAKCFQAKSELRLALSTATLLQVYDAARDSLLWELHSNSPQLVQGNEEPFTFAKGFAVSPDGSTICILAHRKSQRQLFVVDAESGWVKLEHLLSIKDGETLDISRDSTHAALCHYRNENGDSTHFKIFALVEGPSQTMMRRVQYQKPGMWRGMGMRFAPDGKHIVTAARSLRKAKGTETDACICIYNESTGELVRSSQLPRPAYAKAEWPSGTFTPGFHFPSTEEWLVSFPESTSGGKTCIANARLGQIVAVFSSTRSMSQKWQVGVQPAAIVEVGYDKESGIFTRMDVAGSLLSRGQTATYTQFALSANGGRERAVVRTPYQIRSETIIGKHTGVAGLTFDGFHMFAQEGSAGKINIYSTAI